jgi:hypothetical protein
VDHDAAMLGVVLPGQHGRAPGSGATRHRGSRRTTTTRAGPSTSDDPHLPGEHDLHLAAGGRS